MKPFREVLHNLADREILQPTVLRAVRSSVSFMPPFIMAGVGWITPMQGVMASFAAHSISMLDVRGTYLLRLSVLCLQACLMIGLAWVGAETGTGIVPAVIVSGLMAVLAGYVRHFMGEYGPGIITPAALLLFTAMAVPLDIPEGYSVGLSIAAAGGSVWGIVLHIAKWPVDRQYPLRFTLGESWTAAALLFEAMAAVPLSEFVNRQEQITERELQLDQTLNRTRLALGGAGSPDAHPFLQPLVLLLHWAGAVSTNAVSLFALLGKRAGKNEMGFLVHPIRFVLTSLATASRALALAVVSRRSDHLVRVEISLKRTHRLLDVLETRIFFHVEDADDRKHALELVRNLKRFAGDLSGVVRNSAGQDDPHARFSYQLLEIRGSGLTSIYGPINFSLRMGRELVQYCIRLGIVLMVGTAVFTWLRLPHGYWIPFSSLVVIQPDYGSTWRRAFQRAGGTVLGCVAVGAFLYLQVPYGVLLAIVAVLSGCITYYLKENYATAVFIVTIMLVISMEAMGPVGLDLALERLACCVLGCLLAFVAALTLWPFWERQRVRPLLSGAIRRNRDYLDRLVDAVKTGIKVPNQEILQGKMQVEIANAEVFGCLRRMGKEPETKRSSLEAAAVLANGNLRLTRILNALLAGFAPDRPRPEGAVLENFSTNMAASLDAMARLLEPDAGPNPDWDAVRAPLDRLRFRGESGENPDDWMTSRLEHAATEVEGMLFGAKALVEVAPKSG